MENTEEKNKEKNADEIVKKHVYWAVGAGLIPLPVVDIAAVTAIQLDMLKQICTYYKIDYSEESGKAWISALVTSTLSSFVARMGASAVKFIPLIGTLAGVTSMAVLSGASTYALGKAFSNHFENGGTFGTLDKEKVKQIYEAQVAEGKKLAKKLKEEYLKLIETPAGKEKERSIIKKLKELDEMKEKKLITDEEYDKMRKDIFKKLMGED
ncbi:MAG: DUF697 domain-containing protein [Bacteroidales bacterium]